jgi:lysophospholipase L1-like esterase
MSTEFLLRKYDLHPTTQASLPKEDFHPYLQLKNSQKDNAIRPQLHINSLGFRGEEIEKEKSPNTYRIFILGGSTVYNEYTPYEENAARVLEKQLQMRYPDKKIEVINAGVRYYNSEHSIIQYLFKIKDYNPDLIIVWQGANDMAASCTDIGNDTYGQYSDDYSHKFGPLKTVFNYFYSPKKMFNLTSVDYFFYILKNTLYSDLKKQTPRNLIAKPPGKPVSMRFQSINAFKRNLESLIKILREDNVKLILSNQPFLYNEKLDKNRSWDLSWVCRTKNTYPNLSSLINGIREFNNASQEIAEKENIPFLDIEGKIPKSEEYFSDDFHFYPSISNKIVANTFYDYMVKNNFIE